MLGFQVHRIQTGVYICPWVDGEPAALSVSEDRQVTLHCAGGLASHPFPFDEVIFAPFHTILYACCVADALRQQLGAALQRPAPSYRDVPRRATIVHGDPVAHVCEAFYEVLLLAAEEVERIAGTHHSQSPYEFVFNVVRVYPWGEEDLLGAAVQKHGRSSFSPSETPAGQGMSSRNKRTSVTLQTEEQRQVYKSALEELCRSPRNKDRDGTAACVQQVRLAVYSPASESTAHVRALCAEHLFSLVPSARHVGFNFGTTMEALCETLVGRRQGNLLDNPLLTVLLPGVSVECLTILTCISAQGEYASRSCIDACCFGCRRERRRCPAASLSMPCARTDGAATGIHAQDTVPPLRRPTPAAACFQRMAGELLMSVAPCAGCPSWQAPSWQKSSTATSSSSRASKNDLLSRLTLPADRLHASRHLGESPAGRPCLFRDETRRTSPPSLMRRTEPAPSVKLETSALRVTADTPAAAPPAQTLPEKGESTRNREGDAIVSLKETEAFAGSADRATREKAHIWRRIEESASAVAAERGAKRRVAYHDSAVTEATLAAHRKKLQMPCAELERRGEQLRGLADERQHQATELRRTVLEPQHLVPRVANVRQREQELIANLQLLDSYVAYLNATCRLYTDKMDAKCQEADLSRAVRSMELEAAALGAELQSVEERRDATQREMAAETKADAARQVKALEEYEESVSIVRRVQRERDVVARELADLAARRAEVHALEAELVEVHKALGAARASRAAEADARPCVLMSEGTHGESADVCKGLADDDEFALAKCIVGEELDKIIDELAAATSELSEAEDVLIEEADRAALALRRCDSEMKLRFERLMDRFASLMDVESRLAMRSASIFSECSPRLRN